EALELRVAKAAADLILSGFPGGGVKHEKIIDVLAAIRKGVNREMQIAEEARAEVRHLRAAGAAQPYGVLEADLKAIDRLEAGHTLTRAEVLGIRAVADVARAAAGAAGKEVGGMRCPTCDRRMPANP